MSRQHIEHKKDDACESKRTGLFWRGAGKARLSNAGRIWIACLVAALLLAACVLPSLAEWQSDAGPEKTLATEETPITEDMSATDNNSAQALSDDERDDYLQDLVIPRQQYNTFLTNAYFNNSNATEEVNPQSGEFTYRHTDYSLPGKNGLDLNITRIYKSGQTPRNDMSLDVYDLSTTHDPTLSGFYEQRYNIGAGVRFSFPTIEVRGYREENSYRYLHDESGGVHRLIGPETIDGVKTYELEGYKLEDIKVIQENTPTFTGTVEGLGYDYSKYVLIEKDGKKTYFSGRADYDRCLTEGRIMAIVDRYGNTIRFDYKQIEYDYTYTWDPKLEPDFRRSRRVVISKITDTVGREVTIEYPDEKTNVADVCDGKYNVKITTPDNQMIVYSYKNFCTDAPELNVSLRQQLVKVSVLDNPSNFGVNGNYGVMKYFYGYSKTPFEYTYDESWSSQESSDWFDVNFILYGDTNKAKILTYEKGARRYGYQGYMEYPKVQKQQDVLLVGCELDNIRDRFEDENYNLSSYLGVKEYVSEQEYSYDGEPDGYAPGLGTGSSYVTASKVYPLINFESQYDKNAFKEISDTYPQWERTSAQAKNGEFSMRSKTTAAAPAIKLPATLPEAGQLVFHAMEEGDGDLYIGIDTNEPSQMTKFELTGTWEEYYLTIPNGSSDIWFKYDRKGTEAKAYLDDITVGASYSTSVEDEYGFKYYLYDPLHRLHTIYTNSPNNALAISEWLAYDERGQLKQSSMERNDGSEQNPLVVEKHYTYDEYGNLLEYRGPEYVGAKLSYTYDTAHFHQITSRKLADLESGQTLAETTYQIDVFGNTIVEVRNTGGEESVVSDFTYDSSGNMTSKSTSYDAEEPIYTTVYEYAPVGTYPGYAAQGGKEAYAAQPLYLTREYTGSSSAPLSEKRYTYEFDTGLMSTERLGNQLTSYQYDSQYRITSVLRPDGAEEYYTYYPGGMQVGAGVDSYTDSNYIINVEAGRTNILYVYDIYGNLIRREDKNTGRALEQWEHDINGNVVRHTDGNGNYTTYQFDRLNRLLEKKSYDAQGTLKGTLTADYVDKPTDKLAQCDAAQSVTITNENGNPTTYYLDRAERVVGVETTPDGNTFYLEKTVFDSLGNVVQKTDALGNATSFIYDRLSRLTQKTDALGNVTAYTYNAIDKLTRKDEPGGKRTAYEYDAAGRMVYEKVGNSANLANEYTYASYTYDTANNKTNQKKGTYRAGPDGAAATTVDQTVSYTYHGNGKLATESTVVDTTAEGDVTTVVSYWYNDYGELYLKEQDLDYTAPYGVSTGYTYDNLGRKTGECTEGLYGDGSVGTVKKAYVYDNNDNVTEQREYDSANTYRATNYVYDYRGLLTEKREPAGSGSEQRTTRYEYDAVGNLTKKTLVQGSSELAEIYTYDKMNRLAAKTNALGQTERYTYDAAGNRTGKTDARYADADLANAPGMRYAYDALGRQTETSVFDGTNTQLIEMKTYDGRGNVTKIMDGAHAASGVGAVMAYNAQDLVQSYTPASAPAGTPGRTMRYDGCGRLISQTDYADADTSYTTAYTYRGDGLVKSVQYADGTGVSYTYDNIGRFFEQRIDGNGGVTKIYKTLFGTPYKTEYPDGTTTTADYNWYLGLALVAIDQKSRKKKYAYDRAGKLIEQDVWYASDDTNDYWKTTKNTYDIWGNLLASEDFKKVTNIETGAQVSLTSLGNSVTYNYDALMRVISQLGPDGRETKTEYDAAGNLSETKVKLWTDYYEITRYSYDAASRLASESVLIPGSQLADPNSVPGDGKYTSFKALTTTYTYGNGKNVTAKTDARGNTTTYEYNADGKLAKTTNPDGGAITYLYDLRGNLIRETNPLGGFVAYNYDGKNRMNKKYQSDTSGSASYGWQWAYDANGNVVRESTPQMQLLGGGYYTYTYDAMNRRTSSKNAQGELLEAVTYDVAGNVLKRVDGLHCTDTAAIGTASGDVMAYDSLDRMVSKTDALGGTVSYEYDLLGNLTKQTDARGNATAYEYTPDSLLKKVSYPDGGQIEYSYDGKGRMNHQEVKQSGETVVTTDYAYTPFDAVFTEADSQDRTTYYKYDAAGNLAAVTDKRGNTTRYAYDSAGRVSSKQMPLTQGVSMTENYAYDAAGNLTQSTLVGSNDNSRVTTYTYYPNGLVSQMSTNGGQAVQYTYNQAGLLLTQRTLRSEGQYDTVNYAYDQYERLTSETRTGLGDGYDTGDVESVSATVSYTYNILGMKTSQTTPRSASASYTGQFTTTYGYDGLNRLQTIGRYHEGGTSPQQVATTYTYDAAGNTTSVTDDAAGTTSYTYDSMNRVLTVTNARGVLEASYTYDLVGNKTGETRPNGTWTYEYDDFGRLVRTKAPDGGVAAAYEYDEEGNVVKVMDGLGYAASPQYGITYTYNAAGLVSAVTDAEGGATTYTYDALGDRIAVTDATGRTTAYSYNRQGKADHVIDAAGAVTAYEYDAAGNLTRMTDALGHETQYAYGAFGVLTSVTDAAGRQQSYLYDVEGNLVSATNRAGVATSYTYDNQGRLTGKSAGGESVAYAYDAAGNRTAMTDATGSYTYTYDATYRLTSVSKNGITQISYAYDNSNNITSKTYNGQTIAYTYDSRNRMTGTTGGGVTATYAYDAANNLTQTTAGGQSTAYTYNKNNAATSISIGTAEGTTTIAYVYDAAGRVTSKTRGGLETTYTYDAAGRLSQAAMPGKSVAYAYDAAGNRTEMTEQTTTARTYTDTAAGEAIAYSKKITQYEYFSTNELAKTTAVLYNEDIETARLMTTNSYNPDGSLYSSLTALVRPGIMADGGQLTVGTASSAAVNLTEYRYDAFGRQQSVTVTKGTDVTETTYTYNGDGLRTSRSVTNASGGSQTVNYILDGANVAAQTGARTVTYVLGAAGYVGQAENGAAMYYRANAHGDVVLVTDANGAVKNSYEYDAFGEAVAAVETVAVDVRYAGEFYDSSTGQYYLRARYYDPGTGRFTSEDTVRDGTNWYAYCDSDPVNYIDPSGYGKVWNKYGEVIGTTDGKDYVDQSDAAAQIHGGGEQAKQPILANSPSRDRERAVMYSGSTGYATLVYVDDVENQQANGWFLGDERVGLYDPVTGKQSEAYASEILSKRKGDATGQWLTANERVKVFDAVTGVESECEAWELWGKRVGDDTGRWLTANEKVKVFDAVTGVESECEAWELWGKRVGDSTGTWRTGSEMVQVYERGTGNVSQCRYDEVAQKRAGDSTGQWCMAGDYMPVYSKVEGKTVYVRADQAKNFIQNDNIQYSKRQSKSLPKTGRPNSKETLYNDDGSKKQDRYYGPDGQPVRDVDYQDSPVGNPHSHGWTDGKRNKGHEPVPDWAKAAVAGVVTVGVAAVVAASAPVAVVYGIATVIKQELETSTLPSSLDNAL